MTERPTRSSPERIALRTHPRRASCTPWPLVRLLEEAFDQAVGAAAVGEGQMPGEVARRRGEIEALVLLVAPGQRPAGKVPGQAEDADALLGRHALGTGQVAVD